MKLYTAKQMSTHEVQSDESGATVDSRTYLGTYISDSLLMCIAFRRLTRCLLLSWLRSWQRKPVDFVDLGDVVVVLHIIARTWIMT